MSSHYTYTLELRGHSLKQWLSTRWEDVSNLGSSGASHASECMGKGRGGGVEPGSSSPHSRVRLSSRGSSISLHRDCFPLKLLLVLRRGDLIFILKITLLWSLIQISVPELCPCLKSQRGEPWLQEGKWLGSRVVGDTYMVKVSSQSSEIGWKASSGFDSLIFFHYNLHILLTSSSWQRDC